MADIFASLFCNSFYTQLFYITQWLVGDLTPGLPILYPWSCPRTSSGILGLAFIKKKKEK